MALASFSRIVIPEWFEEHNYYKVLTWLLNYQDNAIKHQWDVLDKQVQSMESPPHNLQY